MHAVAVAQLGSTPAEEAEALAPEVGASSYDLRLKLAGLLPAVVLRTPDHEQAISVLLGLRRRGHGAVACDLSAVVPSTAMVAVRRFAFEPDALRADEASEERLPYADMHALIHAVHVTEHDLLEVHRETSVRGSVSLRETMRREEAPLHALYIFPGDGGTPWILHESEARYAGLPGPRLPTQHQSFLATIRALRERAPGAPFDERLAEHPRPPSHFTHAFRRADTPETRWDDHGADLVAHLLALWFAQRQGGVYRT